MQLQSAVSAAFALALPAIVLMYMLKRRYPETEIASHLLWARALREQEANRPWQRLRRSLLLLLQLIIAASLVFALMRPHMVGQAAHHAPVIIVVDQSASMTAAASRGSGAVSALDEALQSVAAAVLELPDSRPVTIIAAGSEPELLLQDVSDRREIQRVLESVEPYFGRTDEEAALTLAEALMRGAEGAELWLATDGRFRADAAPIAAADFRLFAAGRGGANTAIASFGLQAGEQTVAAAVTLVHYGSRPAEGTLALMPAGGSEPAAERPFRLEPGGQRVFTFEQLPDADYYRAELQTADDYEADNAAFAFPAEAERGRALLAGERSLFLSAALGLAGVDIVQADLDRFEPDEAAAASIDWVVLYGADDQALDTPAWRSFLQSRPVWRIWSASSPPAGGTIVEPRDNRAEIRPHPVTSHITLADTHIARIVAADPGEGMEPVVFYGGVPVLHAGTAGGYPQLVMAFDPADSDLPLRADFPILTAQAAEWLGGAAAGHLGRAAADGRMEIGLRSGTVRAVWETVETVLRGDAAAASSSVEAERTADGAVSAVQTVPAVPGLYRFIEYDADDQVLGARLLAVHAAEGEGVWTEEPFAGSGWPGSAGSPAAGGTADRTANGTDNEPASGHSDGAANAADDADRAADAWIDLAPYIAALLLLLLAAEWEVYRRGAAF